MAEITAAMVKELREKTGSGMMDCKRALAENDGDVEKALDFLRKKVLQRLRSGPAEQPPKALSSPIFTRDPNWASWSRSTVSLISLQRQKIFSIMQKM